MKPARDGRSGRSRFGLTAVALMVLSVTACSGASSPSPAVSPTRGSLQTALPSPSSIAAASVGPSVSATGPLSSVGPAPSGTWTGIGWTAVPSGHAPAVPPWLFGAQWPTSTIWGSSKGYIEALWDFHARTLTPWFSADGLNWSTSGALDATIWARYFSNYDKTGKGPDPQWRDFCHLGELVFQEDPQSMLVTANVLCGSSGEVGNPIYSPRAAWTSSNGLTWTSVTIPSAITAVTGGASGFVGLSADKSVWLSQDGRAWTKGALPAEVLKNSISPCGMVSMANGYALAGLVAGKSGAGSKTQGAVWWSPDATTWTREGLDGAVPSDTAAQMCVQPVDAHTVVATLMPYESQPEWDYLVSADGKTWIAAPQGFSDSDIIPGLYRGLFASSTGVSFFVFDDKLAQVELRQTGDVPDGSGGIALGPTGLLECDNDNHFWIGVPTVG